MIPQATVASKHALRVLWCQSSHEDVHISGSSGSCAAQHDLRDVRSRKRFNLSAVEGMEYQHDQPVPSFDSPLNDSLGLLNLLDDPLECCFDDPGLGGTDSRVAMNSGQAMEARPHTHQSFSYPDGRRSTLSAEERLERTRARNRIAQARFRQKHKVLPTRDRPQAHNGRSHTSVLRDRPDNGLHTFAVSALRERPVWDARVVKRAARNWCRDAWYRTTSRATRTPFTLTHSYPHASRRRL